MTEPQDTSTSIIAAAGAEPAAELVTIPEGRLDQNPVAVYLTSLDSLESRRTMLSALRRVVKLLGGGDPFAFPWASLRYQHVAVLRGKLAEGRAPATVNKILAAIRGVAREAAHLELMSPDHAARVRDVRGVKGYREPAGRDLDPMEVALLFRACRPGTPSHVGGKTVGNVEGARDAALLALLYGAGLRRAEAVGVLAEKFDPRKRSLRIIGKGNKERDTYVAPGGARALSDWLDVRGTAPGPLLVRVYADKLTAHGLAPRTAAAILQRIVKRAKLSQKVSPHDFRRTFVGDLLDSGVDISSAQKLAGHAQVTTTQRYDRRGKRALAAAAEKLVVPYEGKETE